MATQSLREVMESMRRVQAELEAQLPALEAEHQEAIAAARREAEAETERRVLASIPPPPAIAKSLLGAFSRIDAATSISAALNAAAEAAAEYGASVYVGPQLDRWPSTANADTSPPDLARGASKAGGVLRHDGAVAAPLLLSGEAVAVIHATTNSEADREAIEVLAQYAAAQIAALTATRVAQAQRWIAPVTTAVESGTSDHNNDDTPSADDEEVLSARRYARLLVSEIKLYNEAAVNEGRSHRDLSRRLGAEIDRARRLYEERVPPTVADRRRHFHHELIQTLAGGDPSLLG